MTPFEVLAVVGGALAVVTAVLAMRGVLDGRSPPRRRGSLALAALGLAVVGLAAAGSALTDGDDLGVVVASLAALFGAVAVLGGTPSDEDVH